MENDFLQGGTQSLLPMRTAEQNENEHKRDRDFHVQKAALFVKDCLLGNHFPFLDSRIWVYKLYRSRGCRLLLSITVIANITLALTLVEEDSKEISKESSLVRGLLTATEGWCLVVFIFQSVVQFLFMGCKGYFKNAQCVLLFLCTLVYFFDLLIVPLMFKSVPVKDTVLDSSRVVLRFYVRPVYVVLHFTRLRETVPAIVRTARALVPILLFIFNFLVIFAIYGFVLFSNRNTYFTSASWAMYQLLVSLTTANFPDIMIQGYAHPYDVQQNISGPFFNATTGTHVTQVTYTVEKNNTRPLEFTWNSLSWWATPCYFITFHLIGIYFLLSVAFAVVYKVYKEHLQKSIYKNYRYRLAMLDSAFDSLMEADQHRKNIKNDQLLDSFDINSNGGEKPSHSRRQSDDLSFNGTSNFAPSIGDDFRSLQIRPINQTGIDLRLFAMLCRELQPNLTRLEDSYFDEKTDEVYSKGVTVGLIQDCISHSEGLKGTVEHTVLNDNEWVSYVTFDDGSSCTLPHESLSKIPDDDAGEDEDRSRQRQPSVAVNQILGGDLEETLKLNGLLTPVVLPSRGCSIISHGDGDDGCVTKVFEATSIRDKYFNQKLDYEADNHSNSTPGTPRLASRDRVTLLHNVIGYPKGTVGIVEEIIKTSKSTFYQIHLGSDNDEVRYLARHVELVRIEPPESPVRLLRVMFYAMDYNNSGLLDSLQFREIYNMLQLKISTIQDARLPEEKYLSEAVRENTIVKSLFRFGRSRALTLIMNVFVVMSIVLMVIHFECMKLDKEMTPDGKHSYYWFLFVYLEAAVGVVFCLETGLKVMSMGWAGYRVKKWNRFDFYITIMNIILLAFFFLYAIAKGFDEALLLFLRDPKESDANQTHPDFLVIMFLGRLLRSLRISASNASLKYILKTFSNILPIFGVYMIDLFILFYYYASIGMLLFKDKVPPYGTEYSNKDYYALNFNGFWSSCVTLWCLMVVNNWYIIVDGYRACCGDWVILYFTSFWFLSVILLMNIVTALVVEVWGSQWEINKLKESDISNHPMTQRIMNIGLLTPDDGEDYYKLGLPSQPSGSRPSYKVKYRNYSHRVQIAMERLFLPAMVSEMECLSPIA